MKKLIVFFLIALSLTGFAQISSQTSLTFQNLSALTLQRGCNWCLATTLGVNTPADRIIQRWYWSDTSTLAIDGKYVIGVTGISTGRWIKATNLYGLNKQNINMFNALGTAAVGAVPIDTTGPSFLGKLRITKVDVYVRTKTGTQIVVGAFSIGTNQSAYNNITGGLALSVLTVGGIIPFTLSNSMTLIDPNTPIYLNVTGLPTGITAGTLDIYIDGYYTFN